MRRVAAPTGPRRKLLFVGLILAAVAWPSWWMLRYSAATMEEGSLLVGAELVLAGRTPHGGFEHLYGPADVWFVAAAFALVGKYVVVERLVGLGYRLLLLWGVHRIARRWGWGVATGATLLAWAVIAPFGLIAYSWIGGIAFGTASLAVALDAETRPRLWVVSGALAGMALLFRADLVPALGLSLVPLVWTAGREHRRRFVGGSGVGERACLVGGSGVGERARLVGGSEVGERARFVGGLCVGAAAYGVHLLTAGPAAVLQGMFVDPVLRMRPGRRLPVPPRLDDSGEFFARLDHYLRGPETLPGLDRPAQIAALFWIVLAAAGVALWLAWRAGDRRLLAFALLAAGTLPQMLQRPTPNHLSFVGVLILPVAAVAVAERLRRRTAGGLVAPAVLACLVVIAPHHVGRALHRTFLDPPAVAWAVHDARRLPVGSQQAADDLEGILGALADAAAPGDRLFVGPEALARTNYSETYLYYLTPDYEPASYHLQMNPGLANRPGGRLAADVASADWLILTSLFDGWAEPNRSVQDGDLRADAVVESSFCAVETIGKRTLYGRCPVEAA